MICFRNLFYVYNKKNHKLNSKQHVKNFRFKSTLELKYTSGIECMLTKLSLLLRKVKTNR